MKFVIKLLGGTLVLVGLWYVVLLFINTGGHDMYKYHLDIGATIERYITSQNVYHTDFNDLLSSFKQFQDFLGKLNSYSLLGRFMAGINGYEAPGFQIVLNVLNALFDPFITIAQLSCITGYVVVLLFKFLWTIICCIQPMLDIVFNPIFVMS